MDAALALTGNASSVHAEGRAARRLIEQAREDVARLVGAESRNVTFTSGATEANALALTPAIEIGGRREPRDRLFISAIEHPSVLSGGRFSAGQVEVLPVTSDGVVDLDSLRPALSRSERPLVSVMLANNESGVVQPIAEIADIVHAADGVLHVDAVQGPGRIACDIGALGADLMSISSHKLGGPQGAGALIRRGDVHVGRSADQGRRSGARTAGGNGKRGGHCRIWCCCCGGTAVGSAAACGAPRSFRSGPQVVDTADGDLWRKRPAAAQYEPVYGSRTEGGNCHNCFRSQRHSGVVRFRMLVGKGADLPCSGGYGRGTCACAGCRARQPRLDHHRSRNRCLANCLE